MTKPHSFSLPAALADALARVSIADAERLRAAWRRADAKDARPGERERFARELAAAEARYDARRQLVPRLEYPPELPVSQRREEILAAIAAHQVVIVCGETGSGKTTQLPKLCLEAGRGLRGFIGHTQPRRIAARSVAARVAEELGSRVGEAVGCKVRFSDRSGPASYVKLMTDGILLAETQTDRKLLAYDTLIIDEAHERSLNIDFLLGYLRELLPRRPDLKLIVTSATLDAERFSRHFAAAPVIEVSGRGYPVEIRYRPLAEEEGDDERELEEAVVDAVNELARLGTGDILVFLPGEREIRETADILRGHLPAGTELLPLYARLSVSEQQRVFQRGGRRRVVLATNVAETSLTVPGIHYVVDTGLAKVARYSVRNKVQMLRIEKIAQSAAKQRAGRCGRVAPGVCIRLYGQSDLAARPAHGDPEILRSSLAAVILRMLSLKLGAIEAFPFLDPPAPKAIADGIQLLQELGALAGDRELTAVGRDLARLAVEPRLARMVLAARDENCLYEVLIIAAGLSVPDPRERPAGQEALAEQAQARFRDERSDFLSYPLMWEFFAAVEREESSHRKALARCRAHFLSWLRLREWRDIHSQLVEQLRELNWRIPEKPATPASYEAIHRALLAGLLGNIGCKADDGDYFLGARGLKFHLFPGSGMTRKGTSWVVAAELAETTRLYARTVARVEPEWVEAAAAALVKKTYFDPRWDAAGGQVVASERVLLYGLVLVRGRRVAYGAIAPAEARAIFIRRALVEGEWQGAAGFLQHNRRLIDSLRELEHKARREDLLVDEDAIEAFYQSRLPADVCTVAGFEAWRKEAERNSPRLLFMTRDDLLRPGASLVTEEQFPKTIQLAGASLALKYRFEPGHPMDGVTLTLPLALLNQIDEAGIDWLVPGLVRDKVWALFKALPKALRQRLGPQKESVTAFLEAAPAGGVTLAQAIVDHLRERLGETLPAATLAAAELPPHLHMNLRVVDADGEELAQGRDLAALRQSLGDAARMSFGAGEGGFERAGLRQWDFGELPESLAFTRGRQKLTGYPALVDEGDAVALRLFDTHAAAAAETRRGVRRLLRIELKDGLRQLEKPPAQFNTIALALRALGKPESLLADALDAIADRALIGDEPLPRNAKAYEELRKRARARLPAVAEALWRNLGEIAAEYQELTRALAAAKGAQKALADELGAQRAALVHAGFLAATPWARLADLPRYLRAARRRLEKHRENPERDARHAPTVQALWRRWKERMATQTASGGEAGDLADFRWDIEELRVSLFAQELKTPYPVSVKRLEKKWAELCAR